MKTLIVLVLLIAAAGGGFYYWQDSSTTGPQFRTAEVKRGDLLITISATGTLEPTELVDVGAQVAGRIEAFGKDPQNPDRVIDYGTFVEEDTILAHIDEALYAADVARAEAEVESAIANVRRAEADLVQMKARLLQAENNWKRAQELGPSRALSATEFDNYAAAYEIAKATVGVGEASVRQAQTAVAQAQAALQRSRTNLSYCTIRSPVKGVIIDRRVNIGQTVVASLNAPSLFLIAKDLRKMQVWVAVNEADIGSVHPGQAATFTVDAFPGEVFRGTVGKIRLNASMTQNVVTYTVEVNTDNEDGKLLPYLTANVQFEVARRENVLLVPNSALRWTPASSQMVPEARARGGAAAGGEGGPTRGRSRPAGTRDVLWVREGGLVRPVEVTVGLTDGAFSEVTGDDVHEGLVVVTGEIDQTGSRGAEHNPFTPRFFGGSGSGGGGGGAGGGPGGGRRPG